MNLEREKGLFVFAVYFLSTIEIGWYRNMYIIYIYILTFTFTSTDSNMYKVDKTKAFKTS